MLGKLIVLGMFVPTFFTLGYMIGAMIGNILVGVYKVAPAAARFMSGTM